MTSIFERVAEDLHMHPSHDQPTTTGPNPVITTEEHVTTPAPANPIADIAFTIGQASSTLLALGGNQLVAALAVQDLGNRLPMRDVETVTALVRSLEEPHRQAEANAPA